jgi:chromosomal replication initiation ATPase DnaA
MRSRFFSLGTSITLAASHAIIASHKPLGARMRPSRVLWLACANVAAEAFGVPVWAVLSHDRADKASRARWHAWATLRAFGYSWHGIASMTGHDHTSIIHGCRRYALLQQGLVPVDRSRVQRVIVAGRIAQMEAGA